MNNLKTRLVKFFLEPQYYPEPIQQRAPGYHERNKRWLDPVCVASIIAGTPAMIRMYGLQPILPEAVSTMVAAVALMVAGIGVMRTDTFSADAIRYVSVPFALAGLLYCVFN